MTEAGKAILDRVKEEKEFVLAGNSGGYEVIEYKDDTFQFVAGFGAVEEYRSEISAIEALDRIKRKIVSRCKCGGESNLSSDEAVFECWKKNNFIC